MRNGVGSFCNKSFPESLGCPFQGKFTGTDPLQIIFQKTGVTRRVCNTLFPENTFKILLTKGMTEEKIFKKLGNIDCERAQKVLKELRQIYSEKFTEVVFV